MPTYVPLDPAYPVERLAYMLEDSAPVAVLAQTSTLNLVPLDPAYPVERLAYMLEDSAPVAVLAQTSTLNLLLTASARADHQSGRVALAGSVGVESIAVGVESIDGWSDLGASGLCDLHLRPAPRAGPRG